MQTFKRIMGDGAGWCQESMGQIRYFYLAGAGRRKLDSWIRCDQRSSLVERSYCRMPAGECTACLPVKSFNDVTRTGLGWVK